MVNITTLAVPAYLLAKIAEKDVTVTVNRLHHFESANPLELEGIKLVSFNGKLKHFTEYDQAESGTGIIFNDLERHSQQTGLNTEGVLAVGVHRRTKGDDTLTCNPRFDKNELMGMAYVTPEYIAKAFGDNFGVGESMSLAMSIDEALRNLTSWQCDNIYQIKFSKDQQTIFTSPLYYDVARTEGLISGILKTLDI